MCDALAVAHPRESASSYLSSQSLAASRCSLHATSRSSHSRRSLPCHFLLCRVVLFCLVLRRRRLPVPCSRGFFRLSAQLRPPRGVSWPLESIELPSRKECARTLSSEKFFISRRLTAMSRPVGWCSRLAGGAVWCRGAQLSCGLAAARRRGSEQCDRSRFVPACRRCRFFAKIFLNMFLDKFAPELLLLD